MSDPFSNARAWVSRVLYQKKMFQEEKKNLDVCVLHNQLKIILFYQLQYIEHAHHQSLIAKLLVVQIQIMRNARVHVYQKVGPTTEKNNVPMVQMKAQ